jgi:hypothetical protein
VDSKLVGRIEELINAKEPDRNVDALHAAAQLRDTLKGHPELLKSIGVKCRSSHPDVAEAAALALFVIDSPLSRTVMLENASDLNPLIRLYGATGLVDLPDVSRGNLEVAVASLIELVALPSDVDALLAGRRTRDSDIGASAATRLRELATEAGLDVPKQELIPLAAVQRMPRRDVEALLKDRFDELLGWWRANSNDVVSRVIKKRERGAATKNATTKASPIEDQ